MEPDQSILQGAFLLVLHAHLPYARHPEHPRALEECWLFEAISETYLPLIEMLERLAAEGRRGLLALSVSPPLAAMLEDELLQKRFDDYLQRQCALLEDLLEKPDPATIDLEAPLRWHLARIQGIAARYHARGGDLLGALARLARAGVIELLRTTATHAVLPLLRHWPESLQAQLSLGAQAHQQAFGLTAPGLWLPECAYDPMLLPLLRRAGVNYCFLDAACLTSQDLGAGEAPPMAELGERVVGFFRHNGLSRLVWDAQIGYPHHAAYREFHHDLSDLLPLKRIGPYLAHAQIASPSGVKPYCVTGGSAPKAPYDPAAAQTQARADAAHFVEQLAARRGDHTQGPIAVLPFDAELFGHWWLEGIDWLEALLRAAPQAGVTSTLPAAAMGQAAPTPLHHPARAATWGRDGDNSAWLNPRNAWVYPLLDQAHIRLRAVYDAPEADSDAGQRALCHMGRCLLLAQASDWPFLLDHGAHSDYAAGRVKSYLARFHHLATQVQSGVISASELTLLEELDPIFPRLTAQMLQCCEIVGE
ncbi:putative glycoside hydrolase [Magnetofaba australis IT-1]|uniref:Putative glycoside hydrolase n=1 Tax=Magnetofaba australis IT-1 TaxID=1434232 RepID=A0A1Y2K9C8_9PROT|nr:putative glycoside hydrolase [Magnetofaba australis IT-1]